ncbi:hypothetical protein LCGC14_1413660 [marine sediment metagenome]|uniref:Glycosyltransferase 2-like domain-containing protein n=1 Tax=marine sediment metagenome TaxID=412755 RepID=A0A0F9M8V2_9ZZZZ
MGSSQWEEVRRSQDQAYGQGVIRRKNTDPSFVAALQSWIKNWKDKKRVLIAEPSVGMVDYQAHDACWALAFEMARYETRSNYKFFKLGIGRMLPAYAREKFGECAVDYDFDYIFYMDDDHIWPKNIFELLEKHIDKYDIVAPLCVQRLKPYKPVIYDAEYKQDGDKIWYNNNFREGIKKGDFVTGASSIGMGAAIIKVDLLRRMEQPWFFSMQPVGEDLVFTLKATTKYGAKILVDTNIEAPHLCDRQAVGWEDHVRECKS